MADKVSRLRLEIDGQQVQNSFKDLTTVQRSLNKELKGMEVGTDEYIKKSQQLNRVNKRLDSVKKDIKSTGQEWKTQTAAYKKGISDRIGSTQLFGTSLGQLAGGFGLVSTGIGGTSKALKIFKFALAATGIGAILLLFGSLITYLTSTQAGMDAMTKVTRPLAAIFQKLIGVVQELGGSVFKRLSQIIENPKQALIDLGNAIKDNVIARFEALSLFGPAIAKIFKGEFVDGFVALGDAAVQMGTGIRDVSTKIKEGAENLTEFIDESIQAGTKIDVLTKQIRDMEVAMTIPLARLRVEFQKQKAAAQDRTKSEEERLEAAQAAIKTQDEILKLEQGYLDKKIQLMQTEHALNDTSKADELELVKLKAERIRFEEAAVKKQTSARMLEQAIERERMAEEKKQKAADALQVLEAFQQNYEAEKLLLIQQRADQLISKEEYNSEVEALDMAHLVAQIDIKRQAGEDTLALEETLAAKEIALMDKKLAHEKLVTDTKSAMADQQIADAFATGQSAVESAETLGEATKAVLNSLRDQIKAEIGAAVAKVVAKALINTPFPLNIGLATAAGAASSALLNKFLPSFATGGETGFGDLGLGSNSGGHIRGVVEEGEFVIPRAVRNDPYIANVERYVTGQQAGTPASGSESPGAASAGGAPAGGSDSAVLAKLDETLNVLLRHGISAKFAPEAYDEAKTYQDEIETLKSSGL
jgi:hypothetical protein